MGLDLQGKFYNHFLDTAEFPYTSEEQEAIQNAVTQLIGTETLGSRPGMLLGKIQSGKTKTFMAIAGLAFDNDFDISVILTKGTKALARQTEQRIQKEFEPFLESDDVLVYDIMNMPESLSGWELKKKIILVVKKEKNNLDRLLKLFSEKHVELSDKKALIVDDEADFASIGYRRNDGDIDTNVTAQKLDQLRNCVSQAAFLQVTATPYSLYLQPEDIQINGREFLPIRPAFTVLVPVNEAYIGSDYYFDSDYSDKLYIPVELNELTVIRRPDRRRLKIEDVLTSPAINGLRAAFCNFLVGGVIRHLQADRLEEKRSKFSFLVHTEVAKSTHEWQEEIVNTLFTKIAEEAEDNSSLFQSLISEAYNELNASLEVGGFYVPREDDVLARAREAITDGELMITSVNSDKQVEALLDNSGQLKLRTPFNIFIGGQILDRGITIGGLIGFYYGRRPNRFQQDTVLQHSRMYGYRSKEDMAVTRFYTEPVIYAAMQRMHESDIALREEISKNPKQAVNFIQSGPGGAIVPCSPNKILLSETVTLRPWKRILPVGFQTDYKTYTNNVTKKVDDILNHLTTKGPGPEPFLINLDKAHEILDHIKGSIKMSTDEGYDFDWSSMHAAIDYMAGLSNSSEIWCLWLSNRNNARLAGVGSHTRYVATPDTASTEGATARQYATETPMLTLFRQNGSEEQGWMGAPFYWPLLYASGNVPTTIYATDTTE